MELGIKGAQKYQSMFVFMSIVFLTEWVLYTLHLMRRWQQINPSLRTDASCLTVFAIGLWVLLIRESAAVMQWQCLPLSSGHRGDWLSTCTRHVARSSESP